MPSPAGIYASLAGPDGNYRIIANAPCQAPESQQKPQENSPFYLCYKIKIVFLETITIEKCAKKFYSVIVKVDNKANRIRFLLILIA